MPRNVNLLNEKNENTTISSERNEIEGQVLQVFLCFKERMRKDRKEDKLIRRKMQVEISSEAMVG